jgi:hypothetical protein
MVFVQIMLPKAWVFSRERLYIFEGILGQVPLCIEEAGENMSIEVNGLVLAPCHRAEMPRTPYFRILYLRETSWLKRG